METKELARIFKAVADNVSDDKSRNGLTHVFAKDASTLEATDGHALIRVSFPVDGHGLTPGFYEPKQSVALLKASVLPQPVALDYQWPQTDQVIPRIGNDCELTSDGIGFNPALLARVLDSAAKIANDKILTRSRFTFTDEHSPARIDIETIYIRVTAVVMPMRREPASEKPTPRRVTPPAPVAVTPSETPAPTRGPRPGYTVTPKPCPVCGTPNAARRFSFLCESHRSPEYLAAHKRVAA